MIQHFPVAAVMLLFLAAFLVEIFGSKNAVVRNAIALEAATVSTVLISTQTNRPITVGITQFSSFNMIEWQYLFAAALLATVPVIILFMLIEKHLAAGLTAGGVKG